MLASCDAGTTSNNPTEEPSTRPQPMTGATQTQADVAHVLEAIERMSNAFNRGELAGVMATYENPATVLFEPGKPASTTAQVRAGFEQFLLMKPEFRFSAHEVYLAGDIAVHHTPWAMQGTGPDGTAIEGRGLSVAVLRRQADGGWLMVIDNPNGGLLLDTMGYPTEDEAQPDVQESGESAAVVATIDRMTNAFAAGDVDGVMATYASDATVLFQPGIAVNGLQGIRAAFEGAVMSKPAFRFGHHEVIVSGDIAVHTSPWTMTATGPDGATMQDRGLSVAVLKRQADGAWLMVIDNPHGQRLLDTVGHPG